MQIKHNGPLFTATAFANGRPSWRTHGEGAQSIAIRSHKTRTYLDVTVQEVAFANRDLGGERDVMRAASITINADEARQLVAALCDHFEIAPAATA